MILCHPFHLFPPWQHKDAYMENTELNPSLLARLQKDEDRKIEVTRDFLHLFTASRYCTKKYYTCGYPERSIMEMFC